MVSYVDLMSFEAFDTYANTIDPKGPPVYFYFSGKKDESGKSWCPDCVEARLFIVMPHHRPKNKPQIHNLNNYEEFTEFVDNLPDGGPKAFFLFSGAKRENGRSWCISCQLAEPVVKQYLNDLNRNIIFAYVDVGDVPYWRDKDCPFRTDNRLRLMQIPTLIKWKGVQRLEGSQCNKRDLLQILFEEEEE